MKIKVIQDRICVCEICGKTFAGDSDICSDKCAIEWFKKYIYDTIEQPKNETDKNE